MLGGGWGVGGVRMEPANTKTDGQNWKGVELNSFLTTHRLLHTTAPGSHWSPCGQALPSLEGETSQNRRHTPHHMESQQSLRAAATVPGLLAKASSFTLME